MRLEIRPILFDAVITEMGGSVAGAIFFDADQSEVGKRGVRHIREIRISG